MAVCYGKLFHLMIDRKITNSQLKEKAGFSANIITRLKKNEYISLDSIECICKVLDCGVDDILEFDFSASNVSEQNCSTCLPEERNNGEH